jgi:hypothetical protein
MHVDSIFVADMREYMSSDGQSPITGLVPTGFSIGGVVQLACMKSACAPWFNCLLETWRKSSTVLDNAFLTFEDGRFPSTTNIWDVRGLEFYPIRGKDWANCQLYHPFESRFCKAAKQAGFGNKAKALAGALYEMADNVAQHSGADSSCPAHGLIGYYICDGHVAFAIADLGRGVLNSLKENPAWYQLTDSKAALMAVITDNASRRPYGGDGEGFKEVFRSLANISGLIELSSSNGRVRIMCTPEGRQATPQFTGSLPGFQLSVNCSLNSIPGETIFSLDYLT